MQFQLLEVKAQVKVHSSIKCSKPNSMFNKEAIILDKPLQVYFYYLLNFLGIWLSRDKNANVLILDVEGSDSAERKFSDNVVEN